MKSIIRKRIFKDDYQCIWISIIIGVFLSCLEGVLSIRYANIFGNFADAVFSLNLSEGLKYIWSFAAVLLITIVAIPVISFINDVILVKNAFAHDRKVLEHYLEKSCDAAGKIDEGDMLSRLDDDPNDFRQELIALTSAAVMIPVTLSYLLFNVLQISWIYFIIVLAVSLLKFFVPIIVKKAEKKYHMEQKEYASEVRSYETEISSRSYLLNLFGLSDKFIDRLDSLYRSFFQKTKKKSIRVSILSSTVSSFLNTLCLMVILLVGAYMVSLDQLSPGSVAAMIGYYSVLNIIINNISYIIRKVLILNNLVKRLEFFYNDSESSTEVITQLEFHSLDVGNVNFSYENKKVLNAVSFSFVGGDKVAVCGGNGSGKSTLLKVLFGLLSEYEGDITVNNIELSKVNMGEYRNLVAYIPQDPYIFKGTVTENIAFDNPCVESSKVIKLMEMFEISHLINCEVECKGNELSGGEKQKNSIIRAIIKDTPVVFMDEPENNLDKSAMQQIETMICSSDKTLVYISHDAALIKCANKILNLDN